MINFLRSSHPRLKTTRHPSLEAAQASALLSRIHMKDRGIVAEPVPCSHDAWTGRSGISPLRSLMCIRCIFLNYMHTYLFVPYPTTPLVADQGLVFFTISIAVGFDRIDELSHFFLFVICQHNVSGGPILFQPLRFGRAWDCYHALCSNPSQCNLGHRATLLDSQSFNLIHDRFVLVEIFALKLWGCTRMSAGVEREWHNQD